MTISQRRTPASSDALESLAEQLSSMLCEPSLELALATQRLHLDTCASDDKEKKAVNFRLSKKTQNLVSMVYAKQFAISMRSILSGSIYRPKTLLDQPIQNEMELKAWKHTDEFTKLAVASAPLYEMAKARSWELKTFTLILNKNLSARLDNSDSTALEYIRDQMTRLIRRTVDPQAEFLYGIEKAPKALAENSSRRRWHLHGLMIGPVGFSKPGKTELRMKLRAIKGEADSDLMFKTPGEKIGADPQSSARQWCVYAVKNGLTVELNPLLAAEYELPEGKPTFISSALRREAKRWHAGKLDGLTVPELRAGAPSSIY
ncbi:MULTISPECIES: hypothetical protein [Pseudomonas]|uniref:Replication protein n=1 Tax=Pseudomonas synxantha TaxID=47883 RepID=A0ABS0USC7_9PSED|nr:MULTISPECIES: hypothetical protein [Pseudomonas]MBI6568503.1 hypothetical protein [Pseudomonas synxantha]MBI6584287.1 hypothetical protein [Pseudomonas synxantha]MBI6646616.1 hypothetical protein [Pseudomonas synxantha]OJT28393.1 hypothetical protein BOP96_20485 [Pseudomonas sp. FSL W5-0203]